MTTSDVTPTAQMELPLKPHATRDARRFLRQQLSVAHHATVEDEAELLVSELIGGLRSLPSWHRGRHA